MATPTRFRELGKKIVAVGRNYSEHAKELGNAVPTEPVIFMKPATSYISVGENIKVPEDTKEIHHEVELGVVIGQTCKNVSSTIAMESVAGYTIALDMTDREKQTELKKKGLPWELAKGFDTSCPVGEFIPKESIPDPHALNLWLKVNGEMRQNGGTTDMIFRIPQLLSFISGRITLEPGDLVLTGTPAGVGPVKSGDVITAGIDGKAAIMFVVE